MTRYAIYARVATVDRGQNPYQQLPDLRRYVADQGGEIVAEFVEEESGTSVERPLFKAMMLAAYQRKFDVLLFWALDRFSQEWPHATLHHLHVLRSYGANFYSYTEPGLEVDTPMGEAMVAVVAAQAAQSLVIMSHSIRRALRQKQERGEKLGRPGIAPEIIEQARQLHSTGKSLRAISTLLGVSKAALSGHLKPLPTDAAEAE